MGGKSINISDAKTHLSQLIARVERGERILIARAGKPVAELRPVGRPKKPLIPPDDPLLRVHEYGYDGPIRPTTNRDIDDTVYDVW